MPLEGEAKRKAQAKWRADRTPAYFAWLYARRKVRLDNAASLRLAVEEALIADELGEVRAILAEALEEADQREREAGNRYDHENDRPYYLAEEGMML